MCACICGGWKGGTWVGERVNGERTYISSFMRNNACAACGLRTRYICEVNVCEHIHGSKSVQQEIKMEQNVKDTTFKPYNFSTDSSTSPR